MKDKNTTAEDLLRNVREAKEAAHNDPAAKLDKWWAHLAVETKEKITGKPYPQCTTYWNALALEHRQALYDRAGGRKAHRHHEWKKGNTSMT